MGMDEAVVEEFQGLETIGMCSKQPAEDVFHKGTRERGRREEVEECRVKGLQWERVVVDDSGECVNINFEL